MATVHTPVPGFTGEVAGVAFADGTAEVPDDKLTYFRRHGYGIDGPAPLPPGASPVVDANQLVDDSSAAAFVARDTGALTIGDNPTAEGLAALADGATAAVERPAGNASTEEWANHAAALGVEVEAHATRADIIAAVDAA